MDLTKEHEWLRQLERLCKMYQQSFPEGDAGHFVTWVFSNYGYVLKEPLVKNDSRN